jgi:hypothetical protein
MAAIGYAKVYIAPKTEMIRDAAVIAIVHIDKVESTEMRAAKWLYHQRAHAKVERLIKGTLPWKDLSLFGDTPYVIEGQAHFSPGRFLVFLAQDTIAETRGEMTAWEAIYVTANRDPSVRPLNGDKVEWYTDEHYDKKSLVPLQTVLDEIQSISAVAEDSNKAAVKK